jgi:hypothetical protein
MDIQDLGAIGEFISSVVIVVTLIFLTLETRQARKATLQANRVARQNFRHDLARQVIEIPSLTQAYQKAEEHLGESSAFYEEKANEYGLTTQELRQLQAHMRSRIYHWHDQFYTDLPEEDQDALKDQIRAIGSNPCYRKYWPEMKANRHIDQDFVKFVDELTTK